MKPPPTECRNGHVYASHGVRVGFRHCGCDGATGGGHTTYRCEECGDLRLDGCVNETKLSDYRPG